GEGAIFIDDDQVIMADSPKGKVKNTVGSGDSMIAGFLAGIQKGKSKVEAFKLGVQSGSATAFNEDLATKEDIEDLNNQVKTRKVEKNEMTDVIRQELMLLPAQETTKEQILDEMVQKLVETGAVDDFDAFRKGIAEREESMSTGLGDGIAMPHAKNAAVKKSSVVFAKQPAGVDFDSL